MAAACFGSVESCLVGRTNARRAVAQWQAIRLRPRSMQVSGAQRARPLYRFVISSCAC